MINRKRVEQYLPLAVKILKEDYCEGGGYPNALKGYIASFGAAMTLGHWQATIAFYSKKDNSDKNNTAINKEIVSDNDKNNTPISKEIVSRLVFRIIQKNHCKNRRKLTCMDLMSYALQDRNRKKEILEVVVALKLALNLFEAKQEGTDDKEQRA